MNNKKLSREYEAGIIAMANRNYANNGRANSEGIAIAYGITPQHVMCVLRHADNRGLLTRYCSAAPYGVQCGAPIPDRERGNLRITNCDAHRQPTRAEYAQDLERRSHGVVATRNGAPIGEVTKVEIAPSAVEAPPMPECIATALDGLTVELVNGEPRASAIQLAELLGFKKPIDIKELIERNREELEVLGRIYDVRTVRTSSMPHGGTKEIAFDVPWLNRTQCTIVAMRAGTPSAAEARGKIAKSFEREQDRAAAALNNPAPAPAVGGASVDVAAIIAASDARMERMFDRFTGMLATVVSGKAPREPASPSALPAVPQYDRAAAKALKGDYMSGSDIAAYYGLPATKAWKQRTTSLVTLFLQVTGVHRHPEHSREIPVGVATVDGDAERTQFVYAPSAVTESLAMRHVADSIRGTIGFDDLTDKAYVAARKHIKETLSTQNGGRK